ncbi:hotdog fold thioesterase [Fibrella sp. HMF5335]|uniref:Hotdog fold thioesterase n=1 Tax=Fibrella rubiginis TaxID=2817060 RepID=A0A939GFN1_9BACT|nr:hotdog fold thioesterase [Fibrella rubiginis]MBO0936620.1 hotdog fold thioesterase [Fibrella rubiginis]
MKYTPTVESLNELNKNSISGHLGIELVSIADDLIVGRMPVDARTHQPFGILHGGASVVLAESLGSTASMLRLTDPDKQRAVGLEINANHIRSVSSGWVYGRCTPIHVGRTTHVWDIRITDEQDRLVCVSRLTIAVIAAK